jgi:molybdopterin molybdotransferase
VPTFDEARRIILEHVHPLGAEPVPVLEAAGRVLGEDISSPWDFPAWDNSAMDGYAVRADGLNAPAAVVLSDYIPAGGTSARPLAPGTAAKILTGAPLPAGADAVVPFEEAEERDGVVSIPGAVRTGAHVRRMGEDIRAGEIVLRAGTILGPPEVSYLASCARLSVSAIRRARVAILSTGDELVAPGEPLGPGKIHDSNAIALAAAVKLSGAEPILLGIARDDRPSLQKLLAEGLQADALVTSAGVSMGDRDLVRLVLDDLGVRQVFWKIDIKPGRPTAFAIRGDTPIFSLPGNPVSALLTFEQFVRPAVLRMMGHRKVLRPLVSAILGDSIPRRPGRTTFVRVRLVRRGADLLASSAGRQDTGILKTMLEADGIAIVPGAHGDLGPGDPVQVQVLRAGFEMCEA